MILGQLSMLEEVRALHAIILHAGEEAYHRLHLNDFVNVLRLRASTIHSGSSTLGHPDVPAEVDRLVQVG